MAVCSLPAEVFADFGDAVITVSFDDSVSLSNQSYKYTESRTLTAGNSYNFLNDYKWIGKKIKWKTYDKTIASVTSKGKVTALKSGTTKIVAKASDGTRMVVTVTVENPAKMESYDYYVSGSDTALALKPYYSESFAQKLGAKGYIVYYYDMVKKGWIKLYSTQTIYDYYFYCFSGLKPNNKYYFKLAFYKNENGKVKIIKSYINTLTTPKERPHITKFKTLKNGKYLSVGWNSYSDWDGYQIEYTRYLKGYSAALKKSYSGKNINLKKYIKTKKTTLKAENCLIKTDPSDEDISVTVRGYNKVSKKKKSYSLYSRPYSLDSIEYVIDNYMPTGTPGKVYGELDNMLVNNMLSACIKKGLSPYEKVSNIHYYVGSVGDYEYDYNKIDPDPLKALIIDRACQCYSWAAAFKIFMDCSGFTGVRIVGGTKHGANHWWVEVDMNGQTYLDDPYYGSWFFMLYPEDGYFTKIYG